MAEWRYIAQRALTGEFLHWDLPLVRDELRWDLSGPGALRASISPELGGLRAADGSLLLDEWGTLIYAEANGVIRWGGIVVHSAFEGPTWSVEAAGFAAYPTGVPYTGYFSRVSMSPFDAVRHIWDHVQGQPDGDLGVDLIIPDEVPARLGKPGVPARTELFLGGKWQDEGKIPDPGLIIPDASSPLASSIKATSTSLTLKRLDYFAALDTVMPITIKVGDEQIKATGRSGTTLTGLVRGQGGTTATAHYSGTKVTFTGTPSRKIEAIPAEPYLLSWWEAPDCGGELDNLAKETPFDYAEEHYWSGDEIRHRIRYGYPRLGSRRSDLAFIQGDNVISVVGVDRNGDEFANEVIGLGKGEGAKSLRTHVAARDKRLRRPRVWSDKSVGTSARLTAFARDELNARRTIDSEVSTITVLDHPNAPIASWSLGDDVLVQATLPWVGDIAVWSRIVAWTLDSESRATLSLVRSDRFRYGSESS